MKQNPLIVGDSETPYDVLARDGCRGDINAEDLGENLKTFVRNARRRHSALFIHNQKVPSGVHTAFHHDHITEGGQYIDVPFGGDIGNGDASGVPTNKGTNEV